MLALLGDTVTTDHISPAGAIKRDGPAGRYLQEQGVAPRDFNSYGSRRGNHEVMMRGTFANIRIRNLLRRAARRCPKAASRTTCGPRRERAAADPERGEQLSIYDAAMRYVQEGVPLVVLAGKEYGIGLLARLGGEGHEAARRARGDRAELRAHPPLQPRRHGRAAAAVPRRAERRSRSGSPARRCSRSTVSPRRCATARPARARSSVREVRARARPARSEPIEFDARVRIDTPREADYFRHGGILQYVLRGLLAA